MQLNEEELKKKLGEDRYHVLREKGTEAPFTGELLNEHGTGDFTCGVCGATVFKSETKFDSGCGWPSFYDPADTNSVKLTEDQSLGIKRVEVTCSNCGSHLGHVFNDAPAQPTGLRFCINSASLDFKNK